MTGAVILLSIIFNPTRGASAPVSADQAAPTAPAAPADAPAAKAPAVKAPAASSEKKVGKAFTADMGNGNTAKITILSATYGDAITTGP